MAGLHASTVILDGCWTLWLLAALRLLGRALGWARWLLLLGFAAIAPVLGLTTGLSWHGYLMAWLGAHAVLAAAVAVSAVAWRRRQGLAALVSLAGLVLLWVQGGAGEWPYVAWSAACVACAGAGFGLCWMTVLRTEQRKTTTLHGRLLRAQDMYAQERKKAWAADQRAEAADNEARELRAELDRVRQERERRRPAPPHSAGRPWRYGPASPAPITIPTRRRRPAGA